MSAETSTEQEPYRLPSETALQSAAKIAMVETLLC